MSRKSTNLPDLGDEELVSRLLPLSRAFVPGSAEHKTDSAPAKASIQSTSPTAATTPVDGIEGRGGNPVSRITGGQDEQGQNQRIPNLAGRIAAVSHQEAVRSARGPKKNVEFVLPERLIYALKVAAAQNKTSMTVKVLEALKSAGYPVTDEDFIDLRKLAKK